jgi:hypothetical protein
MIFKLEVVAIYANAGEDVSQQRRSQIDSDLAEAQTRLAAVTHYTPGGQPDPDEALEPLSEKYGAGWRCAAFLNVRQDGDDVGRAVATRLATRTLRPGSKVQVFEHLKDTGDPYAVGELLFEQAW